ncbi:hypothetical protein GCM10025876_30420 [Demequina litorisediminis]|uniref:Uncharacterized protein n=1 Tax=Demequina litorisediminis TaxID=1849022 RepID=A0ABQ6II65_9MICO|nr:hypothetical protein [Demequina litorisediminis]GMA36838.1 hypothetical protein GCM10025876_30420 [Demequina litorisediminis]
MEACSLPSPWSPSIRAARTDIPPSDEVEAASTSLTLDVAEWGGSNSSKTNANRKSTVPLLAGVRHRVARHAVIGQSLKLRSVSARTQARVARYCQNVKDSTAKHETGYGVGDLGECR